MKKTGFTLIELLIVIALLGALAIGLIGAIDPFEQLKKGTDTGTRNTVSEIQSSIIRYYALKGRMPWCTSLEGTGCIGPVGVVLNSMNGTAAETTAGAISTIVATGELKANFTQVSSKELDKVYVTGTYSSATVCFHPESKSFNADDNSKYTVAGATGIPANCPGAVSNNCYWCVQ